MNAQMRAVFDAVRLTDAEKDELLVAIFARARERNARPARRYALPAAVAALMTAAAVALAVLPAANPSAPAVAKPPAREIAPASAAVTPAPAAFVDPLDYAGGAAESKAAPLRGKVFIEQGVRHALEDPATNGKTFFVAIEVVDALGATALGRAEDYIYNGRTMAEWRELADLANGVYPYEEYNGDHGGKVTVAQYEAAVARARALDAEDNRNAAEEAYAAEFQERYPQFEAIRQEAMAAEAARLKELGFTAELYKTWEYTGAEGEKTEQTVLAAVLSKEQLARFAADCADPRVCMIVDWVRNGDGAVARPED